MIKTTLIGHASMLIQSKEASILTDPVWFDYLWEEINVLCPSIDLNKDKIPPVDILNISHRHQATAYQRADAPCVTWSRAENVRHRALVLHCP